MRKFAFTALFLTLPILLTAGTFDTMMKNVHDFTLDNGLKVIVFENHQAPVVSMVTYVNVGSVNERPGITGIAHIFEHMAFKGTDEIGTNDPVKEKEAMDAVDRAFYAWKAENDKRDNTDPKRLETLRKAFEKSYMDAKKYVVSNEYNKIVEEEGCSGLNAYTAWDNTAYFYNFPSNKVEVWAYMESQRFSNPRLREFFTEKEVVMEERRMRTDSSPTGRAIEEFIALAYMSHPYHHPPIGWTSDLKTITRQEAQAWFDAYYQPGNMVITIAGDVTMDEVKPLMENYFGPIAARAKPEPVETKEIPQRGERREVMEDPSQPFVVLGYHKGDFNDPNEATFNAITDILGTGRTSRLYKRLVRDDKIALAAGAFTGIPGNKFPGLFIFYGLPMQGHTNAEVEKAILEEAQKIATEPVSDEELARVKARAKGNFLRELKSNSGIAHQLAFYQTITGDWRDMFSELDKIDKVTKEDIMRVAKKTFVRKNRTVVSMQPPEKGGEK